jgi:hypothetical protein
MSTLGEAAHSSARMICLDQEDALGDNGGQLHSKRAMSRNMRLVASCVAIVRMSLARQLADHCRNPDLLADENPVTIHNAGIGFQQRLDGDAVPERDSG